MTYIVVDNISINDDNNPKSIVFIYIPGDKAKVIQKSSEYALNGNVNGTLPLHQKIFKLYNELAQRVVCRRQVVVPSEAFPGNSVVNVTATNLESDIECTIYMLESARDVDAIFFR